MQLEQFERNIKKLNVEYSLHEPATDEEFAIFTKTTGLTLPFQVKHFYSYCNGVSIPQKGFTIFPIHELCLPEYSTLLEFCTINGISICFETSTLNNAEQWDIIEFKSGYRITLSMASFWTNKIWKWLRNSQKFWREDFY